MLKIQPEKECVFVYEVYTTLFNILQCIDI